MKKILSACLISILAIALFSVTALACEDCLDADRPPSIVSTGDLIFDVNNPNNISVLFDLGCGELAAANVVNLTTVDGESVWLDIQDSKIIIHARFLSSLLTFVGDEVTIYVHFDDIARTVIPIKVVTTERGYFTTASVLVSIAGYDNIGLVLNSLGILHDQLTQANHFEINSLEFISRYDILFINCGARAEPQVIRAFVEQGGLVYASDLTLGSIIAPAFPEFGLTHGSHGGTVAARILDEGLRVQLGGRDTVDIHLPGGNFITGWARDAEVTVHMDWDSAGQYNPIIASFEHGEGRVIFTHFHHSRNLPANMRRILAYLAFDLYLEDEVAIMTKSANNMGFGDLLPVFGSAPRAGLAGGAWTDAGDFEPAPAASMIVPGEAGWELFDGTGILAAAPAPQGVSGAWTDTVELEIFTHMAVEGETFAVIVAADLGDFLITLIAPNGDVFTNEAVSEPSGALTAETVESTVISLGAQGLKVINPIGGYWNFTVEAQNQDSAMFAAGIAIGFGEGANTLQPPVQPFADVSSSDWFYAYVSSIVESGLMMGISSSHFAPNMPTTRAMFLTVLWRLMGEPTTAAQLPLFHDISNDDWFFNAALWATSKGLVSAVEVGYFAPHAIITREQMGIILYQLVGDVVDEIMDRNHAAQNAATRAEMAAVMLRLARA